MSKNIGMYNIEKKFNISNEELKNNKLKIMYE